MRMDPQSRPTFASWLRRNWGIGLGVTLLIAGGLIAVTAPSTPPTFGWFAYQPDAHTVLAPPSRLEPQLVLGLCILGAGILTLTAVIGYRVGRRARR